MSARVRVCSFWFIAAASLAQAQAQDLAFERRKSDVELKARSLTEASGMAASTRDDSLLWLLNDSGSPAELFLTDINGADRGKVLVDGVLNVDWEDLASFVFEKKSYLLIADTGDNGSQRSECALHIVAEPAAPQAGAQFAGKIPVAWSIHFRYEDGPRDCESVSVDAKAGKILLLSKRTNPPMLYELPLKPEKPGLQIAKKIGQLSKNLPNGMPPMPFGTQPTGMSIAADGSMAAVVTYAKAFIFPRHDGESWAAAFAREPLALSGHHLRQAESIAFSRDGSLIRIASEGAGSPIVLYGRVAAKK
ncbi:hypothetical protein [Haloferula sp. BvORR071]|uniref:hypothetical protein n=1 Tax=Haloferula sp. BvORR071 TaxID=1396141 RepID=UPI0005518011|nr:hypothetical protein [Haloferula sp. BvORR071]